MRASRVVLLSLALYACYLPIAWYLERSHASVEQPAGAVAVLGNIRKETDSGFAYFGLVPMDRLEGPVQIYEDNTPLGPADAPFNEIRKLGKGRYALWRGIGFAFSASDNSDPRTNGRHYWIVR
jgi:hypothetical protein